MQSVSLAFQASYESQILHLQFLQNDGLGGLSFRSSKIESREQSLLSEHNHRKLDCLNRMEQPLLFGLAFPDLVLAAPAMHSRRPNSRAAKRKIESNVA